MSAENRNKIILSVDDVGVSRYTTTRALRRGGFEVWEAATGKEALGLAANRPDLILLDVNLPDMSGFEVCRRVRSDPSTRSIPILHISATRIDRVSRVEGLDTGADGYLVQPVDPAELIATINALLRMKAAEMQTEEALRKLRATFHAIGDGIFLTDADGRIADCNGPFLDIVQKNRGEVIGRVCREIVQGAEDCLAAGSPENAEESRAIPVTIQLGDRWFLLNTDPMFDEEGVVSGAVHVLSDITEMKRLAEERERIIRELQEALKQVKTLSGLLPICSYCKKIRNDKGYWQQIESYIAAHSEAQFTHGICKSCMEKLEYCKGYDYDVASGNH